MFSYFLVALFAVLSLSVSSTPLPRAFSSHLSHHSHTVPSALPTSSSSPYPTTDDCSNTTSSTPAPPPSSAVPTTSAAPTTPVASTPSTSPAPVSTAVATVADATDYTGVATYYYQNGVAGACGVVNTDSAIICAMDQALFGTDGPASPLCGQQVHITNTNNGVSLVVTIADDCPSCQSSGSIDLSVGAFEILSDNDLSIGEFPISWYYVN